MAAFRTLIISAVAGALLAVAGVAALTTTLDPSAAQVARQLVERDAGDPAGPPVFYGRR
jgi:hypothetical protein